MSYSENYDLASDLARQALALMEKHKVAPHPQNFEIWFNYISGHNPDLRDTLDRLIEAGEPFTAERTDEIYARFFSLMAEGMQITDTTARLDEELRQLITTLDDADGNTQNFSTALADFTGALQSGNEDSLKTSLSRVVGATTEMRQNNQNLETQLAESAEEVRQLRGDLDSMRHEAFTDSLTGIANRRMFDHELNRIARDAAEAGRDLCLLMLDIDHFKKFNDTYGHQIGDQVLKLLAATVKECVKGRDIPARYGGEEFSVILPDTSLEDALTLAEQVRIAIGGKKVINKQTNQDMGRVTVSIGAGQWVPDEPLGELIRRADEALYFAKTAGRNRVVSETEIEQTSLFAAAETG